MIEPIYSNPHQLTTLLLSNAPGLGISAQNRPQPHGFSQHNTAQNSGQAFETPPPQHPENQQYLCPLKTDNKTKRGTPPEKNCTRLFDSWEESIRHLFNEHYFCSLCKRENYDERWGYNLTQEQALRIKKCFYKEFKYLKDHVMRDHANFVPCGCHVYCQKKFGLSADRKRHVTGLLASLEKKNPQRCQTSLSNYYTQIHATDLGKSGWKAQKLLLQFKNRDQYTIFNTVNSITVAEQLNEYLVQQFGEVNKKENFLQVPGALSIATSSGFATPLSPRSPTSVCSEDKSCGGVDLPQEDTEANHTTTEFPIPQDLALWQTGVSPSQQHLEPVNEEQDLLSGVIPSSPYNIHSPAGDFLSLYETIQGLHNLVLSMDPEDPHKNLTHNALNHLTLSM
ncbi:hypothetical protein BZA77DRAFT_86758 [Pyronema omphalodes]|nr:hypothetical protein BZA77DRAFT_86758 [Pyronema omphalodes]